MSVRVRMRRVRRSWWSGILGERRGVWAPGGSCSVLEVRSERGWGVRESGGAPVGTPDWADCVV